MPFRTFMELMNQPYWTWETTVYGEDTSIRPIQRVKDGLPVYYFLLPGFNKDNLEITQSSGVVTIYGKREGKGVGNDVINLSLNIHPNGEITAAIKDGILRIAVTKKDVEVKQITIE